MSTLGLEGGAGGAARIFRGPVVLRNRSAVEQLARMPGLGRPGRVAGTRELVIAGTP